MPRSKSKSKAKTAAPPAAKKAPPAAKFLTCGETGDRIFVATATLADISNPPNNNKRKILYKVPSTKTRTTLYDELALCLEDCESRRLPKYGGRSWQVICRVTDSSQHKGSPFFRFLRGKLELAVLPHLLEKIPEPPKFPGYIQTDVGVRRQLKDEEDKEGEEEEEEQYDLTQEEVQRMESLLSREVSSLSQAAWDHRNDTRLGAPLPTISLKWTCPLRQIFTSRKAAWDHALELAKAEQFVDRFLRGLGKNGALLKPFRPTRPQALQAGKVRFLRDGLWVVGQEQDWQNERYLTFERAERQKVLETKRRHKAAMSEDAIADTAATADAAEPLKKRRKISGSSLFLSVHRVAFKEKRIQELKRQGSNPQQPQADNSPQAPTKKSKTAEKVGMPTPPMKRPAKGRKGEVAFSLTDAERELRKVWKNDLSDDERKSWDTKAVTSFQMRIDLDDQKRWELAEKQESEPPQEEDSGEEQKISESDYEEANEDSKDVVELASTKDRALWGVLSQAEQNVWTRQAAQTIKSLGEPKKPVAAITFPEFEAYQRRVYHKLFALTPEEYTDLALRRMRALDRRRQQVEQRKQKELLAKGMKHLTVQAQEVLELRVEDWLMHGIRSTAVKSDEEPELETLPMTTTVVSKSSSTPISPSPPLVEPIAAHGVRNNDENEAEQSASNDGAHADDQYQPEDEEEVDEEVPRFVPTNQYCLTEKQIKLCMDASMDHFDAVMRTVKARDLTRELVDGFDLLRERGRGRYDMELPVFDTKKFAFLNDITKTPWMPIVRQVLGDDVVLIHKGCFLSLPDATNQKYHQDGPHLHTNSQRPCHAVNVFTPLVDMTMEHGPTEFCLGSHILGQEDWDRRYIDTPLQRKGVPVMFDYRLGHRGLANTSKDPRPIVYCTYARAGDSEGKEFRDSVNFSRRRYRKLGDMVEKPKSRDERNKQRREQLDDQLLTKVLEESKRVR